MNFVIKSVGSEKKIANPLRSWKCWETKVGSCFNTIIILLNSKQQLFKMQLGSWVYMKENIKMKHATKESKNILCGAAEQDMDHWHYAHC